MCTSENCLQAFIFNTLKFLHAPTQSMKSTVAIVEHPQISIWNTKTKNVQIHVNSKYVNIII